MWVKGRKNSGGGGSPTATVLWTNPNTASASKSLLASMDEGVRLIDYDYIKISYGSYTSSGSHPGFTLTDSKFVDPKTKVDDTYWFALNVVYSNISYIRRTSMTAHSKNTITSTVDEINFFTPYSSIGYTSVAAYTVQPYQIIGIKY